MKARLQGQRGFTLIEILVALALLGVIVVTLVSAFASTVIATTHHRQQTTLDLVVRSEAEYIKSRPYQANPGANGYGTIASAGYTFSYQVLLYNPGNGLFNGVTDSGLQEIVLTVTAPGGGRQQLDFLKVDR